jgi:hypothetical protein
MVAPRQRTDDRKPPGYAALTEVGQAYIRPTSRVTLRSGADDWVNARAGATSAEKEATGSETRRYREQVKRFLFAVTAIYKSAITGSVYNRTNLRGVAKRAAAAGVSLSSEAPRDTGPVSRGCTSVLLEERLTPAATKCLS